MDNEILKTLTKLKRVDGGSTNLNKYNVPDYTIFEITNESGITGVAAFLNDKDVCDIAYIYDEAGMKVYYNDLNDIKSRRIEHIDESLIAAYNSLFN